MQRNDPTTHAGVDLAGEEGTKGGRGKAYVALVCRRVDVVTLNLQFALKISTSLFHSFVKLKPNMK